MAEGLTDAQLNEMGITRLLHRQKLLDASQQLGSQQRKLSISGRSSPRPVSPLSATTRSVTPVEVHQISANHSPSKDNIAKPSSPQTTPISTPQPIADTSAYEDDFDSEEDANSPTKYDPTDSELSARGPLSALTIATGDAENIHDEYSDDSFASVDDLDDDTIDPPATSTVVSSDIRHARPTLSDASISGTSPQVNIISPTSQEYEDDFE